MKRMTLLFICLLHVVFADELMPHHEPIVSSIPPKPNIMLVLDSSGSMGYFDMHKPDGYDERLAISKFAPFKAGEYPQSYTGNVRCLYRPYKKPSYGQKDCKFYRFSGDRELVPGLYSRAAVLMWTVDNLIKEYGDKAYIGLAPLGPGHSRTGKLSYFDALLLNPAELYSTDDCKDISGKESMKCDIHSGLKRFYDYFRVEGGTPLTNSSYRAAARMRGLQAPQGTTVYYEYNDGSGILMKPPGGSSPWTKYSTSVKPSPKYRCQEQHLILLTDGEPTEHELLKHDKDQGLTLSSSSAGNLVDIGIFLQSIDVRDDVLSFAKKNSSYAKDQADMDWKKSPGSVEKMPIITHAIRFGSEENVEQYDKYLRKFVGQQYKGSGSSIVEILKEENWNKDNAWGVFAVAADTSSLDLAFHKIYQTIINSRSGTGRAKSQANIVTDEGVEYATSYIPGLWKGEVVAFGYDSKTERFTKKLWSTTDDQKIVPNQGKFYTYTNNQQKELSDAGLEKKYVDWLKGGQVSGLRYRYPLGDIIDSHITYAFKDALHLNLSKIHSKRVEEYLTYLYQKNASANLRNYLIAGSNDGLLNILYANERYPSGSFINQEGKVELVNRGGQRRYSYFPSFFKEDLLNITRKDYDHLYTVNGTTHLFDAKIGRHFHTLGITSMGAGKEGFVGFSTFSDLRGENFRINFEITKENFPELGYTYSNIEFFNREVDGVPQAVAVFGNGYNPRGSSVVYLIDAYDGRLLSKIPLPGKGGASSPATEVVVTPYDENIGTGGYQQLERIYVGDHSGKLYRIRFLDENLNNYQVNTVIDLGPTQPITVRPTISRNPSGEHWVFFGTGRAILLKDADSKDQQGFYAINDTFTSVQEEELKPNQPLVTTDQLHRHRVLTQDTKSESEHKFYVTTTNTTSDKTTAGWYLELNGVGERVIFPARIQGNKYIVFPTFGVQLDSKFKEDPCLGGGIYGKMLTLSLYTGQRSDLYKKDGSMHSGYYFDNDAPGIPNGANMTIGNDDSGDNPKGNQSYYDLDKLRDENPESQYVGEEVLEDASFGTLNGGWHSIPDLKGIKDQDLDAKSGRLYLRSI
ncbi:PilC/PilY family type IV pilus protein [Ignatzschineria sp. RMDPL8A]|uniref:pilus assembly protein n=1 Tax=Ignatzschineria sp. RMDPL8A TaxID=2999236 RepID=UPI00244665AC|nr:PilC/PilY family type IV pilus protein [Ignatzschineria sp. RMDPL8A]MDG9729440.1 PilC/PilY family type IV pilus protein [Ignatzschineria sp. RMDPL8A]